MRKLEKKIIEKIYKVETRRALLEILADVVLFVIFGGAVVSLARILIAQYIEQRTLDLFEIFSEDWEIIKNYIGEVFETVYQETPKDILGYLIIVLILLFVVILTFIRNFESIKNRAGSLFKHWVK